MKLKPLSFVKPIGKADIGIVTEINTMTTVNGIVYKASVEWLDPATKLHEAWWTEDSLEVINSLPRLMSKAMAHPFGHGKDFVDEAYPINQN